MTATEAPTAARQQATPDRIFQIFQGYQVTAALKAGIALGVFDEIAAGKPDLPAIATAIGAHERGTAILLDALTAVGLVTRENGGFGLPADVDAFLVRARPAYIGDAANVFVSEWHWERFGRLADAVREGGTVFEEDAETAGHRFWEVFATSYQGASYPTAEALADMLTPWAAERRPFDVLDLACGGGLYAIAQGRRHAHARLTLLDQPNVLEITRGPVEEAGLADRAQYIGGDMFEGSLGGPYDLVIASQVFHHFSEARCVALVRRVAEGLKPGGRIAIHDFAARDSTPAEEPVPRLFSLIMLVWTRGGQAYSIADYERMLTAAGFAPPEAHDLPGMPTRFLIAERAA